MQQYYLSTEAQNINQYQKGFEALKGSDIPVHVGAIYGLEILAGAVPEWKTSILMGISASAVVFSHEPVEIGSSKISPDSEAALIVVSRAGADSGEVKYPLAGGIFRGSKLPWAKLRGANLESADLSGSDLYKSRFYEANLAFAQLNGANLAGADLSHARLLEARFCRGYNFAVPDLQVGIEVPTQLAGAKFESANLKGAWLVGANLDGAIFHGAVLSGAHLDGANLTDADFKGSNTDGVTDVKTHYCRTKWSDGATRSNDCSSDWSKAPPPEVACPPPIKLRFINSIAK